MGRPAARATFEPARGEDTVASVEDRQVASCALVVATACSSLRAKAAGVPNIRVHDIRRTCASMLAARGVHSRVAMRILSHSQISVTMNVYTQIASPETRTALDQLNASLDF
ncbi:tyrosine-type recombinase/integrase [Nonomuraea sp. NPDC049725]|uniref:tyrosine-type recombinase/integrase n=1 Tax=Nonomuraea sp. NPDC049725 TaxID=3154508 RepID=UPI0034407363